MKSKNLSIILFIMASILVPSNVKASNASIYSSRHVCPNFELALANSNKTISSVCCYNSYQDAKNGMNSKNQDNLIIIDERAEPKIVDAKYGLIDLTVNKLTYFYESASLNTRQYTGINTSSSYGGVDAAYIETNPSNFAAKVKIANFTGWISKDSYEIIPLSWVVSSSKYVVTSSGIQHCYITNVSQSSNNGGRTIGPKPDMLSEGTYYSYDGHYFYTSLKAMLTDYKNNTYQNATNKNNPYYNYYMYLSNHTKTTYSSINIDEYTRALGYTKNVYSDVAGANTSRLYGQGVYFYNTQQQYGINAILSYSLSRNETGNGRSNLAVNNNNGFGLDAVDTNPTESASYYATFSSSIYGYASKWNSYGYSYATDWRYFGPAFGDKFNGMNVKYATDAYWSEKMAANYYAFDQYFGLNDYNYYQLGVVIKPTDAYLNANTSRKIYTYPEAEDQVVIVGESGAYYKVVSDMNIDANGNLIGSKTNYTVPYNWESSYVYVNKNDIRLINRGKNGFVSPNSVTSFKDSNYTYDLYIENTVLKPKIAKTTTNSSYYYDAALSSVMGESVLKDKYVMVYSTAYDQNKKPVSYLITSDYFKDQKHWVPAATIQFISGSYGKQILKLSGHYEWVCSEPIENINYRISGQYTNSYFPILGEVNSNGAVWYKIPVNLSSNTNSYGYILKEESNARIEKYDFKVSNQPPIITASNQKITQGTSINLLNGVKATDPEDGNLTSRIKISGSVDIHKVGNYSITYIVTDSGNLTTSKQIMVEVTENQKPVITATNQVIHLNTNFNPLDGVKATDQEDGDITKNIKVIENTVNVNQIGTYQVTYQVTDSYKNITEKKIEVIVKEKTIEEKESLFYFNYLKEEDNKLVIQGYNAIEGIDNTLNDEFNYKIVFENISTKAEYEQKLERITDKSKMTRPVSSDDKFDYTYSWFRGTININSLPDGDYIAYIVTSNSDYFAKKIVSNKILKEQVATYKDKKVLTTRNNYRDNRIPLEFIIRSEEIATKTTKSVYNQYNQYRTFKFVDNKLRIKGTSYSIGMDLSIKQKVERSIIFENTKTYKKYSYDIGSITNGLYEVGTTLNDNLDKTRAWFEKDIDITNIPKGEYAIYLSTKSNVSDFGELTELLFRSLDSVVLEKNNRKYSFRVNNNLRYRVELIVE